MGILLDTLILLRKFTILKIYYFENFPFLKIIIKEIKKIISFFFRMICSFVAFDLFFIYHVILKYHSNQFLVKS